MLPTYHIKKIMLCMSVCLLIAACYGQNDHSTTPEIDADHAFVNESDTDTISYITVIDIIE